MPDLSPDPSSLPKAVLKPREDRRLLRGHLWAYRNEFAELPELEDGALVSVVSDRSRPVGIGFYQARGGIAVRLLAMGREPVTDALIVERIEAARRLRDALFPGEPVYRWVHGESDGLPGLIADRYDRLVAVHAESPFYAERKDLLAGVFIDDPDLDGLLFRYKDEWTRVGAVHVPGACTVDEIAFSVDPESGQKTGLFLDQRENWKLLKPFAAGARVLDGHCYVGAWSLHAAQYGAKEVLGVDTSRWAIDRAREHAERNGYGQRCTFVCDDIQSVLKQGETYDVIVLDPPALAKQRAHVKKALGLYQALNRDAMKALNPGGALITASCSQALDTAAFLDLLKRAANAAQRRFQTIEVRGASPDHPALLSMPETRYLTCAVLRMV